MTTIILLSIGVIIGWTYKPAFADNFINKSKEILSGVLTYLKALVKKGDSK
jgi:hypothetical protein